MMSTGAGASSSATSSARRETATVPLVETITMRLTPARAAAAPSRRVPSTWTAYMRWASDALCETMPARW